MYGGLGMSAPSLHRESTDSLIQWPLCKDQFSRIMSFSLAFGTTLQGINICTAYGELDEVTVAVP